MREGLPVVFDSHAAWGERHPVTSDPHDYSPHDFTAVCSLAGTSRVWSFKRYKGRQAETE